MLPLWLRPLQRVLTPARAARRPAARRTRLDALCLEARDVPAVTTFQQGLNSYTGTRDTYVRQDGANATTVRNTAATILVDWPDAGNNNDTQGLLRFNDIFGAAANQIPLGARITRATLTLNTTNVGDGGGLHRMLVDWQDTVTWNTATGGIYNGQTGIQADGVEAVAAFQTSVGADSLDQDTLAGRTDIDVTADLIAWSAGAANFGWAMLPFTNATDGWEFNQSENGTAANRPTLTIEWQPAAGTTAVSFQQGVGGYSGTQDVWIQQNNPDLDTSATDLIFVDAPDAGSNNEHHVLLRFDSIFGAGAGQIPLGSTILGASLELTTLGGNAQGDGGHFNRMMQAWTEASTWNTTGNGIQANDTEAVSSYDSSAGNPSLSPNYTNWAPVIDVTGDLQAWSNGLANNGWAMIPWLGGSDGWGFRSSEHATVSSRPLLRVVYGPAPAPPPPATTLDMVGGGAVYTAGSTSPNNAVALALTGGNYVITDNSPITLTPAAVAAGWVLSNGNLTATGPDANVNAINMDLNLGNDTFTVTGISDPLTVVAGGQTGDALTLPASLTYAGTVSLTGFGTAVHTAGAGTLAIDNLTIGAGTIGSTGTNVRTTSTVLNMQGGSGGVFLTEANGASVTFRATGSGSVAITNLTGTLTIAGNSFGGAGTVTLTSPDAVAVNAPITTTGPVAISANTDGAGTQGFTSSSLGSIIVGSAAANAFQLTVNTAAGTGNAVIGGGISVASGGTVTINANLGNITATGATATGTGGPTITSGAGGDSSDVILNAAGIGAVTGLIRTSTGNLRATAGNGGAFLAEVSAEPGRASATATGPGGVTIRTIDAGNNGLIIDGAGVTTGSGNIVIQADDNLVFESPVGGPSFSGTILIEASLDLVNEQRFEQREDSQFNVNGTIQTTNATANAVVINVSATTTGGGTGGGALLGHITVGNGGRITVNAQAGTRTDRTGRILMIPGGLLDAGPNGSVVLLARNNSIGEGGFFPGDQGVPILITAGTVVAQTSSIDIAQSLSPAQLPADVYITTTGPATFAATTTSAPGYVPPIFPAGTDADIVLRTQAGALTIAPVTVGTTTYNTRTDGGTINLNGATGIVLNGAIGGAGETGVVILNAGGGNITQPGGSVVTTGGVLLTGANTVTLGQTANDFNVVAGTITGALGIADANAVNTGTVTPPGVFAPLFPAATGITATGTSVTGGRLNVLTGANVTGSATAAPNGTLGGTGTVAGAVVASANGTVSPGTTAAGRLTVNGNVTFSPNSTFAVDINGATVATQYDQLTVVGTVSLGGATLTGAIGGGFNPAVGTTFTIIDNDGTDAVTGTFAGLSQGALVAIGGQSFTVSYTGGTGNDVVLTKSAATAPVHVTTVQVNPGAPAGQRSRVTSIAVTFDAVVTFAGPVASAFQLSRIGGGAVGGFTATAQTVGGVTVVTLTDFTGNETVGASPTTGRSLADGRYALTVVASQIANSGGFDGDGNGTAGDNYTLQGSVTDPVRLFRYYGDFDGDGDVDGSDLVLYVPTLFNAGNYAAQFDFDSDGDVDGTDLVEFVANLFVPLP